MTNARDKANIPVLNFQSKGIDDNADATAITIDSSESLGLGTTSPFNSRPGAFTISNEAPTIYMEDTNGSGNKVGQILYQDAQLSYSTGSRNGTGTSSSTEYFRINSAGLVGIGETAPLGKLHVKTADSSADVFTNTVAILENSGDTRLSILSGTSGEGEILFGDSGLNRQGRIAYRHNGDKFVFQTGNTERMTLTSTGLGIGTSSPSAPLVISNSGASGIELHPEIATNTNRITNYNRSGSAYNKFRLDALQQEFYISGSEKMRIDSSGKVGIGNTIASSFNVFANDLVVGDGSSDGGVTVYSGTSNTGNFNFADGTSGSQGYESTIQYNHSENALKFWVNYSGSSSPRMIINSSGKVLINTTVSDNGNVVSSGNGTSGNTACYGLVRGSFKSTLGMDSVGNMNIRNFSGEIYVTDSGGSSTTISPHNFSVIPDGASEDLAWSYYSRKGDVENDFDNTKYISADITKVIRKVENLTGDKLIYTGTGSTDDGSTVSKNIIQDLITRIESLEAEVTALKNQP